MPVNNGFGWDGGVYARITKDFHQEVFVAKVDRYRVQVWQRSPAC
jgi:hypothetical protein